MKRLAHQQAIQPVPQNHGVRFTILQCVDRKNATVAVYQLATACNDVCWDDWEVSGCGHCSSLVHESVGLAIIQLTIVARANTQGKRPQIYDICTLIAKFMGPIWDRHLGRVTYLCWVKTWKQYGGRSKHYPQREWKSDDFVDHPIRSHSIRLSIENSSHFSIICWVTLCVGYYMLSQDVLPTHELWNITQ